MPLAAGSLLCRAGPAGARIAAGFRVFAAHVKPKDRGADAPESRATQRDSPDLLFRKEALDFHLSDSDQGSLLRITPSWANWTYWLLSAIVGSGFIYLILGSAPVYESGPAVLQIGGTVPLASPVEGTIESVEVLPGQQVSADQVLVRFRAEREKAQLERYEGEYELQLLARLRDLSNESAEMELRRLRPELERARAAVAHTVLRAPGDGAVQEVRVKQGDFLSFGDHLLSVVPIEAEYTAIAFLPGHALPQLAAGMPIRLRVMGYAYAYVMTAVESVGRQVIGPGEARRYLGSELEDAVELTGPVVVVRCRLPGGRFEAQGQEYRLYDGMRAEAAIEVRRERLLYRLIPGLRALGSSGA